jgi:hypothetical protein
MLADAAAAHPGDPAARARAYEAGCRTEVQPWWEVSVQMDKAGADPAFSREGGPSPAQRGLAAVFVAAATDPVIGRAMARFWNLLARPDELMSNPELMTRMAAVMADPDAYPVPDSEGPSRQGLLDVLAA